MSKTKAEKKALIEQLRKSPIVQVACQKVGVSRATYYRWRKDNKKFAEASDRAIAEGIELVNDLAESQLLSAIHQGHMTGLIFWLKHHHKAYETRVNVQGEIKHQSEELTDEQSEIVRKALQFGGLLKSKEKKND